MPMEVILKQPVLELGAEADIVRVKPGYARNYLLPRGLAVLATSASKRQVEELKKKRAEREAQELNEAEALASKLGKLTLTFQMKTASNEAEPSKVFGSVTAQDVIARLEEMGHQLDKKKLALPQPLKNLGEHLLNVQLGHGVQTKLKIVLAAPTASEAAEEILTKKSKKTSARNSKSKTKAE
ncbi:MAG: 50S ribosomal protein L9 [bacterium]